MSTSIENFARNAIVAAAAAFALGCGSTAAAQDQLATAATKGYSALCPMQLQQRSPEQVLEAHLAAFRSGNVALIVCDYAKDAIVMLPGTVVQGLDEIESLFAGFLQAAGPILGVTVTSLTSRDNAFLMTYSIDSAHIVVPNGVDTFVIEKGRIVLQSGYLGGLTTR
jgi:SnoaL-like protein